MPETQRTKQIGLVRALTEHYGSPGRLADRRQFEKKVWQDGEDPPIFAIDLETLAVKGFGDMGPNARLRLIRNRFTTGHSNCDLRRHLDSVPPETPMRDIVDRCRVWESHADADDRRIVKPDRARPVMAAVTKPSVGLGDLEALLICLLPMAPVQSPQPTFEWNTYFRMCRL